MSIPMCFLVCFVLVKILIFTKIDEIFMPKSSWVNEREIVSEYRATDKFSKIFFDAILIFKFNC